LPLKIALTVVGDEECADGAITIVGAKVAMPAIELAELTVRTPRFQDRPAWAGISQLLRQPQILAFANRAELSAVLGVVFIQLRPAAEPRPRSEEAKGN
jgi:hypothetical protein